MYRLKNLQKNNSILVSHYFPPDMKLNAYNKRKKKEYPMPKKKDSDETFILVLISKSPTFCISTILYLYPLSQKFYRLKYDSIVRMSVIMA